MTPVLVVLSCHDHFFNHHHAYALQFEFFRGKRVPCFETPVRADPVQAALMARSYRLEPTNIVARLGFYAMDNGTPLTSGTWNAAKAGADAAASAALWLDQAGRGGAFCCSRSPGHHAGADFMGGYCFLNNAAVAAQHLRESAATNVTTFDVDFHHGNGTQSIFYGRADVLFISLHGDPLTEFPFYLDHADETGCGAELGYNHNLSLMAGCSAAQWFEALETGCARVARYGAQALVVSLRLNTFANDPISKFALLASDFSRLSARLADLGLSTMFLLEGGYAAAELGTNAVNVLEGFKGG